MDSSADTNSATARQRRVYEPYRKMICALACFMILDVALVVLNLGASFQSSDDALSINLAGRQRMLSQSMAKALLQVDIDASRGLSNRAALLELKNASTLFDSTLNGLKQGAHTIGSDNKQVFLPALKTQEGRDILARAEVIWLPYKAMLTPLMQDAGASAHHFSSDQLIVLELYARENNLKLLDLMNDLTTHLEQVANQKAQRMLWGQCVGLFLILLTLLYMGLTWRAYRAWSHAGQPLPAWI